MASDLGELILKVGGRPSYYLDKSKGKEVDFKNGKYTINENCWRINWNRQIHTQIANLQIKELDYCGKVYCVEVQKHNTLLVRRNGKVCWSGNCRTTTVPWYESLYDETRIARCTDGKNYKVPGDITYPEWKKEYVDKETKLTELEEWAIMKYKSPSSIELNYKLRNNLELSDTENQIVTNLDSALDKMPVYHGNLNRSLEIKDKEMFLKFIYEHEPGEIIYYPGYISTSKNEIFNPDGNIFIEITNSRKGKDISKFGIDEDEILYKRDSKFKILNVQLRDNKIYCKMEEVNE